MIAIMSYHTVLLDLHPNSLIGMRVDRWAIWWYDAYPTIDAWRHAGSPSAAHHLPR
jgi:hypothetical protein